MNSTSQVNFNIINEAVGVAAPMQGVIFVEGITLRGPINDPSEIITSPKRFRALFGDVNTTSLFPTICMRMLEKGALLRINRITAGTPATASSTAFVDGSDSVVQFVAKYPGVDYNNVKITISDATNGDTDSFNVQVEHLVDTSLVELYQNIKIDGHPTVADSDYLSKVQKNSTLVDVVYSNLSSISGTVRPANGNKTLSGGTDGTTPALVNYVGSADDGDGFYAFDPYDDSYAIACPAVGEGDLAGLTSAGSAYAENRGDLVYYAHLSLDNTTSTALLAEKPSVNSMYTMISSGGLYITHPVSGDKVEIPELGDFLAVMAKVHQDKGEWYAFFGPTLGKINKTLGVVNNFGSNSKFTELNLLAQRQINMVVGRNNLVYLADSYTSETAESPTNHVSIVNLILYIKKVLKPTLESFMGLPLDIPLMRSIFYTVKPFFDGLKDPKTGRALWDYTWEGDQSANSLSDLQTNNAQDVADGKYKVNLRIIPIAPLKEITINIILSRAGVELNVNN